MYVVCWLHLERLPPSPTYDPVNDFEHGLERLWVQEGFLNIRSVLLALGQEVSPSKHKSSTNEPGKS